jgi:hypothetical protein
MKNGNLFFVFIFLMLTIMLSDTEESRTSSPKTTLTESSPAQAAKVEKAKELPAKVEVNYIIECEPTSAGNQTAIIYQGSTVIPVSENGLGDNGLPISGIFPTHSDLVFDSGSKKLTLRISSWRAKQVTGFLEISGTKPILMVVEVIPNGAGKFLIHAFPAPSVFI